MNKKGIIAAVVVIILVIVGFVAFGGDKTSVSSTATSTPVTNTEVPAGVTKDDYAPVTKDSTDTTLLARLQKASVGVSEDGTRVALSGGKASFVIDGTTTNGSVTLGDVAIEKTKGSRENVITTVSVNNGGSGTYTYVVLFEDNAGASLTDKSYALVGDRVVITGIRADEVADSTIDYIVSVSYLDRKAGEPLSAKPTVAHTKILVVQNGAFNPAKEINL